MTAKGGGFYGSDYSTHWYIVRAGCISDMSVELQSLVVQAIAVSNSKLSIQYIRIYLSLPEHVWVRLLGNTAKHTREYYTVNVQTTGVMHTSLL